MHGIEDLPVVAGELACDVLGSHLLQRIYGVFLGAELLLHGGLLRIIRKRKILDSVSV